MAVGAGTVRDQLTWVLATGGSTFAQVPSTGESHLRTLAGDICWW